MTDAAADDEARHLALSRDAQAGTPALPPDVPRHHGRRKLDRSALALTAVMILLLAAVAANVYLTLTRTSAECNFNKDLSGLPVTIAAGTNRPSQLGMAIIAHSREAYRGLGCSGALPPPSPSFVHWAPYFHLSPE